MSVTVTPELTERQHEVLVRIDKRVPIKVIAGDLGVSEARINQHIRALKDKFEVDSMNELVECFRASDAYDDAVSPSAAPYRKPIYRNSQLHDEPIFPDEGSRVDPGEIVLSDAHHVLIDAPWTEPREPVVVPPFLDGDNAVLVRLGAMIGIAFGVVAAVILMVSAAITVSEILDGKASVETELPAP